MTLDTTAQPSGSGVPPRPPADMAPMGPGPVKGRRRPLVAVACLALVGLGGLLSAWAYTSTSNTQEVLAVRDTVHRGEVIDAKDLVSVRVGVDPALSPLPASELDQVVGKRAAMDLSAGGLITAADVVDEVVPGADESIVGIRLTSAAMPAGRLLPGDAVRVVSTPGEQGEVSKDKQPVSFDAIVVEVTPYLDLGETVVDVTVPADQAAELAAHAATGKVALVLDSRER